MQILGERFERDLAKIVLRAHEHKIGIIGDIKKMLRQVCIVQSQWDLQHIFSRESTVTLCTRDAVKDCLEPSNSELETKR